jgi:hypothetical protein
MGVGGWEARASAGWWLTSKIQAPTSPLGSPTLGLPKGPADRPKLSRSEASSAWYFCRQYSSS